MNSGCRRMHGLWPLGLYFLLSLLLFGLPVIGHLDSRIVAADQIDSSAVMWFLAWWPHAILHGLNPFVEHLMFVPEGFNLTWSTSVPGPAVLLAPITLGFGPEVSWNLLQLASPALSAWTAFLLCRHITGRTLPSLIGGYVFGFSPYVLVHLTGSPSLGMVALVPVFVLLVLRRLESTISRRWFVVAMVMAMATQYLISDEVLATSAMFGAVALVLAFSLLSPLRAALVGTLKLLALSIAATAVAISPFLYFFFFGHQYPPGATHYRADLTSFVLPPPQVALARRQPPFVGSGETYLGAALLALILVFIWQERRRRITWVIAGTALAALLCSLGAHVAFHGHETGIPGPWLALSKLPVLRYAIPVRLAPFVVLPVAVIVAIFLAGPFPRLPAVTPAVPPVGRPAGHAAGHRHCLWRWALAVLAVVMIVPDVGSSVWNIAIKDPPFFSTGEYRAYLKPADHVLTVPVWGPNERWQADTNFAFKLAAGYAGNPLPPSYLRYATFRTLLDGRLSTEYALALRRFVRDKGVTAVVVDESAPGPWTKLFSTLNVRPISTGGVLVYRLGRP